MIRRIRSRAGLFLSVGLIFGGWSLAARATQAVTRSEMQSFVYATLVGAAVAVIGGTAGVTALVLKFVLDADRQHARESREQILEVITRLTQAINDAVKSLATHNDSGDAHTVAMRLHLSPVHDKLMEHDTKFRLMEMKLEYEQPQRDPSVSPYRRRQSDPDGEDHAGERGRGHGHDV